MIIEIMQYGDKFPKQIECVSFEFRSSQVSNWVRIIRYDGTAETIHRIAVVRSINLQ